MGSLTRFLDRLGYRQRRPEPTCHRAAACPVRNTPQWVVEQLRLESAEAFEGAASRVLRTALRPILKLAESPSLAITELRRTAPTNARFFDNLVDPLLKSYRASLAAIGQFSGDPVLGQGEREIARLVADVSLAARRGTAELRRILSAMLAQRAAEVARRVMMRVEKGGSDT